MRVVNKEDRVGIIKTMNCGEKAKIIDYINAQNILVQFINTKEKIQTSYDSFIRGSIKSKLIPSVYGKGYIGIGIYNVGENKKHTIQYKYWQSMLERCYSERKHNKYPSYKGCTVCEEWLNFQNFAQWFDDNFYQVNNERMHLDKDILHKGNKLYSPDNCVFVPQRINELFVNNKRNRGEHPIGVTWDKYIKSYKALIGIKGKNKTSMVAGTPEEAFNIYKKSKENIIKDVADEYRDKIPLNLYNSLHNYKIEITD